MIPRIRGPLLAGLALLPGLAATAAAQPLLPVPGAAARQAPLLNTTPEPPRPAEPPPATRQAAPAAAEPAIAIALDQGIGRLVQLPRPATTVVAADPRVARVQPISPTSLFLMGVDGGRTTVVATGEDGRVVSQLDISVRATPPTQTIGGLGAPAGPPPLPGAGVVEAAIRSTVRRGAVRVRAVAGGYHLSGTVQTAADAYSAEAIAHAFAGEDRVVINELSVLGAIQVNLRVRVAEVSRQLTREFGINWSAIAAGSSFAIGYTNAASLLTNVPTAGQFSARYRSSRWDLNALVDLLAADRLITILAEPNLTAQSGEVASFLAGGEFPIPVAATLTGTVTIEFKQFGVSLAFIPTVLGNDRLNLRVRPEVSELSDNGAVSVPLGNGGGTVRIPALTVRRAETTIELGSGQSFAIAGLLQKTTNQYLQGVQGVDEVPVLGALFRSQQFQRQETELVIIVTPYIVNPAASPAALASPTDGFRPATDLDQLLYRRQLARGAPPARHAPVDAGFIVE